MITDNMFKMAVFKGGSDPIFTKDDLMPLFFAAGGSAPGTIHTRALFFKGGRWYEIFDFKLQCIKVEGKGYIIHSSFMYRRLRNPPDGAGAGRIEIKPGGGGDD